MPKIKWIKITWNIILKSYNFGNIIIFYVIINYYYTSIDKGKNILEKYLYHGVCKK